MTPCESAPEGLADGVLAHAVALAGLPGIGPAALRALVGAGAEASWARVVAGDVEVVPAAAVLRQAKQRQDVIDQWSAHARRTDPLHELHRHRQAGVDVQLLGAPGYPPVLAADLAPPAVVFSRGHLGLLERRRAAIVGTRRCTSTGASIARELGRELARAGVAVVSGLALGIDGAAHAGALAAARSDADAVAPIGVVASGLDVVYPRRHRSLWDAVAGAGLLVSEWPLGTAPTGWRFPARNRLIAAVGEVLVVVESHARGGSWSTVNHAEVRGTTVLAVPGSPRNPAAAGTNRMIADGCHPVVDAIDVGVALGLAVGRAPAGEGAGPDGHPDAAAVRAALGAEPATLDDLAGRTGLPLPRLASCLAALQGDGAVVAAGAWFEQVAGP